MMLNDTMNYHCHFRCYSSFSP